MRPNELCSLNIQFISNLVPIWIHVSLGSMYDKILMKHYGTFNFLLCLTNISFTLRVLLLTAYLVFNGSQPDVLLLFQIETNVNN